MSLTAAQSKAISARGNVLVIAGAGTGKTRTLVERCIDCLLKERPRVSLDQILMVTFTEAAAAEMRHRIRKRLEQEAANSPSNWWQEQLALFDTAHIGTLHSFCLRLIREHFYQLELDPQLTILPEEEDRLLADETLEQLMQEFYAGPDLFSQAVRKLIEDQGRGSDVAVRRLVLRIHHYNQTLPSAARWLQDQKALYANTDASVWGGWLRAALADLKARWLAFLAGEATHNPTAAECFATLRAFDADAPLQLAGAALESICLSIQNCPRGNRKLWAKPLKELESEARFLCSLTPREGGPDPVEQDWLWVRDHMATLVELASRFTEKFTETKRELGAIDFQDLEQYALKLLWDRDSQQATEIARMWGDKLRFVFVDEYQDINAAQDKIIECLSREGQHANRFLVGDVKQSIYRFRLADPAIFQAYAASWQDGNAGRAIPLQDNFRSRGSILSFVNSLFAQLMHKELGGVVYDEAAHLRCGRSESTPSAMAQSGSAVELHLRLKDSNTESKCGDDSADELNDLREADKEARLIALRLQEIKRTGFQVWDEAGVCFRPADWGDMAILLRSPSGKADSYAKEFSRLGVPLVVERGGFYASIEVSDLLSLLQLLDNPLQDIPALAVLRSPLVGLTANELALIRLAAKDRFWTALTRWRDAQLRRKPLPVAADRQQQLPGLHADPADEEAALALSAFKKVDPFLQRFARWRDLVRHVSLCRCLQAVLAETHYQSWLLTQPRGEQRHANVNRLLALAQQFDRFQRQGLFRFLRFLEAQQDAGADPPAAAAPSQNAVRLMSIHQSKGLEFPVVVVADLAKPFNYSDLKAPIILDPKFGLCPEIKPPHTGKTYPSIAYWLARQRQTSELLGEEMRLLYVAVTRARDKLLLVGSLTHKRYQDLWLSPGELSPLALLRARSFADWLGRWFAVSAQGVQPTTMSGENQHLRWTLHEDSALGMSAEGLAGPDVQAPVPFDEKAWRAVQDKLAKPYPHAAATVVPAKTSVTLLRVRASMAQEDEMVAAFPLPSPVASRAKGPGPSDSKTQAKQISSLSVGSAHHLFLQLLRLESVNSIRSLKAEAARLLDSGALTADDAAVLDFRAIASFWGSSLGSAILGHPECVQRELPFTFRAGANELYRLAGLPSEPGLDDETVIVQGVADLVVLLPEQIWLVDFKTDSASKRELPERVAAYEPQLKIYALALSRIYVRPVTRCSLYFLSLGQEASVTLPRDLTLAGPCGQRSPTPATPRPVGSN